MWLNAAHNQMSWCGKTFDGFLITSVKSALTFQNVESDYILDSFNHYALAEYEIHSEWNILTLVLPDQRV